MASAPLCTPVTLTVTAPAKIRHFYVHSARP
jgi:hypothetical protein